MFHNIFTDGSNNTLNILPVRVRTIHFVDTIYENLDINIYLYPIANHISYIYLQLLYNIQKLENSYEFSITFYYDISIMIIFWFIQPITYNEHITNWEIVVFSTIHILSNILKIAGIELIKKPLIPSLVIDETKYIKMRDYCRYQFSTMNFSQFNNYNTYFNNEKFVF